VLHATNLRIPIVEVEGGSLTALAGFDGHQGVALVVEPRRFASLDDVLARAAERDEPPFILVLDSLEDPHNVGTLLRSAEAAGVHGVLFPTHRQAPLSPSAVKASAGAIEHLLLCPVDDLPGALSDLHTRGVRIAGAEGDAPMTARQSDLRGPLAIVVGSEGQGLGPAVRRRADLFMRIPMKGAVGSLNAAVAGSILLFEALAQRDPNATPRLAPALGAGAVDQPARPSTKSRAARASKLSATAAPATASDAQTEASVEADEAAPADTTPKRRTRKGLTTEPDDVRQTASNEGDAATSVETQPKSTPKPRARKGTSTVRKDAPGKAPDDAVATATVKPKPGRRTRKPPTTEAADPPAEAGTESPEDDLLPTDGPRKRSPRAR
jgi:23S rRNA (guanosine2251-2'-O)-methyltransferase